MDGRHIRNPRPAAQARPYRWRVEQAERRIDPLRTALAHLDAVLQLFDATSDPELIPAIRPTVRGTFFKHGEQMRLCLEALREAKGPMRARAVAEYAMLAKGLPVDDRHMCEGIADQVRIALTRMERRGTVRRVIVAPEV